MTHRRESWSYLRDPIKFVRNFIPLPVSKGASKGRYTHTHTFFSFLFLSVLRYLLRRGLLEKNEIVREPGNPVLRLV